jgi:hypothetical protein
MAQLQSSATLPMRCAAKKLFAYAPSDAPMVPVTRCKKCPMGPAGVDVKIQ